MENSMTLKKRRRFCRMSLHLPSYKTCRTILISETRSEAECSCGRSFFAVSFKRRRSVLPELVLGMLASATQVSGYKFDGSAAESAVFRAGPSIPSLCWSVFSRISWSAELSSLTNTNIICLR